MARIVGYIGCSIDGFVVDAEDGMDWLHAHGAGDYGKFDYTIFIKSIGTIVMGRTTYEWLRNNVKEWPYQDHETLVVTSTLLANPPFRTNAWLTGVESLTKHLAELPGKDVWICGGGKLQSAIIDLNALDYLEIYVVPILVGGGTRLWPGSEKSTILELDDARHIDNGIVRLAYRRKP